MSFISTSPVSYLNFKSFQFIIMDAPTDYNLATYVDELESKKVTTLVRTCLPTYEVSELNKKGIRVIGLTYPDGSAPTKDIILSWLNIVNNEMLVNKKPVAVHCVAGLGRSVVLVAIALIEYYGLKPGYVINMIRDVRKGAFNNKQCKFLQTYKPIKDQQCCIIL
mmetsp:Transcript_88448/g.108298  ORF Transcript_88448/g.108298 Transcript_88448/m.108298 type:complete len:165 (+) Transcript_88448:374-868(+)